LKISYEFVIPNPVNEQALSGPQSRAGFAREWAELASRGEGPCVSEVVKLHHYPKLPRLPKVTIEKQNYGLLFVDATL